MIEKRKFSTRQLTYVAIFVTLSVIVNSVRVGFLSFGGLPIIMSGYILGPGLGFVVGIVTDIVGVIVRPPSTGGINPLFVLTSGLTGFIPVFVSQLLRDRYPDYKYWKLVVGIIVGQFITSVFMVNIFIDLLYAPGTFWVKMPKAAVKQLLQAPIYAATIKAVLETTSKQFDFRNLK